MAGCERRGNARERRNKMNILSIFWLPAPATNRRRKMKTNMRTTFILLERGYEDVQMYAELRSILVPTTLEIAKKYPKLLEVMQGLRDEIKHE